MDYVHNTQKLTSRIYIPKFVLQKFDFLLNQWINYTQILTGDSPYPLISPQKKLNFKGHKGQNFGPCGLAAADYF